jgi:hypothetical protein
VIAGTGAFALIALNRHRGSETRHKQASKPFRLWTRHAVAPPAGARLRRELDRAGKVGATVRSWNRRKSYPLITISWLTDKLIGQIQLNVPNIMVSNLYKFRTCSQNSIFYLYSNSTNVVDYWAN